MCNKCDLLLLPTDWYLHFSLAFKLLARSLSWFPVCTFFVLVRHWKLSPHICVVTDFGKRKLKAWAAASSRSYRKRLALREEWMDHSPGFSVLSVGDNVWLSRVTHTWAAVTTPWEKRNGVQPHMYREGVWVWSWWGWGGLVSLRTKESTQLAVGQAEQPKGYEKIKGASLAGSAFFYVEKRSFQLWIGPLSCKKQCQLTHI